MLSLLQSMSEESLRAADESSKDTTLCPLNVFLTTLSYGWRQVSPWMSLEFITGPYLCEHWWVWYLAQGYLKVFLAPPPTTRTPFVLRTENHLLFNPVPNRPSYHHTGTELLPFKCIYWFNFMDCLIFRCCIYLSVLSTFSSLSFDFILPGFCLLTSVFTIWEPSTPGRSFSLLHVQHFVLHSLEEAV